MADYQSEMARLSTEIEFWREELRRCLDEGDDPTTAHETLDTLDHQRLDLALSENWNVWADASADIDAAQAAAMAEFKRMSAHADR